MVSQRAKFIKKRAKAKKRRNAIKPPDGAAAAAAIKYLQDWVASKTDEEVEWKFNKKVRALPANCGSASRSVAIYGFTYTVLCSGKPFSFSRGQIERK